MQVSIIGLGWLGLQVADLLIQRGHLVKGTVTTTEKALSLKQYYTETLAYKFPNPAPESIFDADAIVLAIPPGKTNDYLGMIWTLAEEIKLSRVKQVLFLSSVSVYPECNQLVDEMFVGIPDSSQGKILLEAEKILSSIRGKVVTICRLGGLVGKLRHPGRFLAGRKGLPNPKAPVNLIHGQDVADLLLALLHTENESTVYNICSSNHPTRITFYTEASLLLGLAIPEFQTEGTESWKLVSNQKILTLVGGFEFRPLLPELPLGE
jgi:nucleoside-diphosphate-sugar epimerase